MERLIQIRSGEEEDIKKREEGSLELWKLWERERREQEENDGRSVKYGKRNPNKMWWMKKETFKKREEACEAKF